MILRFFAYAAALLFLAGCSNQVPLTTSFSSKDKEALIIFGTSASPELNYDVNFSKFDPETRHLDYSFFKGISILKHRKRGEAVQYHSFTVDPGSYVFSEIDVEDGYNHRTNICLSRGTFRFDAKPGQIIYVGNIIVRNGNVGQSGFDMAAARDSLMQYPKIKGEVIKGELIKTSFENGKTLFGDTAPCGGYYSDDDKSDRTKSDHNEKN
jgi:hypothetical protein